MVEMTYQMHNLFPIPLYQTSIKGPDPIMEKILINSEFSHFDEASPTHLETPKRQLLDQPQFANLKKQIQEKVDEYVYEVLGVTKKQKWLITTSWLNKAPTGGYHPSHWHSNSLISGVYYLKTNPTSGAICFHKERSHNNMWRDTFCIDFEKTNEYNTDCAISPKPNDLLLFPSILNHSVLDNLSQEDRYSLAFNVFPRGIIGEGGNSEISL
jgi:uncharacterized protein (TIGR02466 family)